MCLMCNPTDIRRFVSAGHATFTLSSVRTGARYTYQVNSARNNPDVLFVSLLTGTDNESSYTYIGTMGTGWQFRCTKKSRLPAESVPVMAVAFFCEKVLSGMRDPASLKMEFRHGGKCGRCGRTLTVPESIDRGIGPECANKMGIG
jgi:Family of unknown function (DUF6011)